MRYLRGTSIRNTVVRGGTAPGYGGYGTVAADDLEYGLMCACSCGCEHLFAAGELCRYEALGQGVHLVLCARCIGHDATEGKPWHITQGHSGCPASKPYAVVQDSNGRVVGCHATRAGAEAQLRALYANE